jgi:hypothetical protein
MTTGRSAAVACPAGWAHRCSAAAGGDHGRLQGVTVPPGDLGRHGLAVCGDAEDGEGGFEVVAVVGVEADPPVRGGVVAGHRVPDGRQLPAVRLEQTLEAERRRGGHAVDLDGTHLGPAADRGQLGHGQRRARHRRRSEARDVEDRRQDALGAGQAEVVEEVGVAVEVGPEVGGAGAVVHGVHGGPASRSDQR